MKHRCRLSGVAFEITPEDTRFYQKLDVPPPTVCPEERARRRMGFSNQRHLFHRECAGSGKKIITNYPPNSTAPVFDVQYWFSDEWNQVETGRDFDFSRPFFEQFADLLEVAPRPSLQRAPSFDENSDFTNYAGKNKNCYLIFDSDKNWDCYYSYSLNSCRDVMDSFRLSSSELCYECLDCTSCYGSLYLQNCDNCSNSLFLKNCIGCSDCFACVNLKNKRYHYFNEALSKAEYETKMAELRPLRSSQLQRFHQQFIEFAAQFPQRAMQGVQNENVLGDYLTNCKNAQFCFDSRNLWDCRYITQAFDDAKDCMDCTEVGDGVELLYESCYVGYQAHLTQFTSHALGQTSNITYCYFTPECSDCFGCVGIHHAQFRILNKQYSKDEYHQLRPRIVDHMKSTKEWGEFFPAELSPFPYNLSHAHDYMPLEREEALKRGYRWHEQEASDYLPATLSPAETLEETTDSVVKETLACEVSGKNYRIQKPELAFYRKLGIPLPRQSPEQRFLKRLGLRNPRVLYKRNCKSTGEELYSTIAPELSDNVVSVEAFADLLE